MSVGFIMMFIIPFVSFVPKEEGKSWVGYVETGIKPSTEVRYTLLTCMIYGVSVSLTDFQKIT
jgi:hypothetical protein